MEESLIYSHHCANLDSELLPCQRSGKLACSGCKLVAYCSKDCQRSHWEFHRKDCKSPFNNPHWRPTWDREARAPAWAANDQSRNYHNPFGSQKYMWGNTPAFDVLQLKSHEGLVDQKDLALLFAASGDLRNVVRTIADLPNQFQKSLSLTINDRDSVVVARNLILLLLALDVAGQHSAETDQNRQVAKSLVHIWYSSFINSTTLSQIQAKVLPLISGACDEALLLDPGVVLSKSWYFTPQKSLQATLKREEWLLAKRLCGVPGNLTFEKAQKIRTAVTLAPERADYRDRWRYKELTPALRVAQDKFREDGMLLPFGHTRNGFDIPNPTLFHDQRAWPLDDKADPLTGWPIWDVRDEKSHTASDIYGKLFVYLQKVMGRFLERLAILTIHIELCSTDVRELALQLPKDQFARVEISNISDAGYLGIHDALALLAPLLQPRHQNPHSTLITLFLNAVMEIVKASGEKDSMGNINLLMEYLPQPDILTLLKPDNADMTRLWDARTLSLDVEAYFQAYMGIHKFAETGMSQGVHLKSPNTIIEEWPTQLKRQISQKGAREAFFALLGSNLSGTERYVEWRRF